MNQSLTDDSTNADQREPLNSDNTPHYLTVKDLNFYYADFHALRNVNVCFEKNTTTTLIGASGSGKTTLLRTFNRIYELQPKQKVSGKILLEDQDLLAKDIDVNILRRKIGMVFQKATPFPMTIFDNIAFAIKLHEKISKQDLANRVEEALRHAALWDEVKDKMHNAGSHLSGGQQQRLCIARTIAIRPDILLLDEPTSALDPISTAKIEELVSVLEKEFTIIMVTHNLKQAQRLGDYTIFMGGGKVIEQAPTGQLFGQPQDARTVTYIEEH
jgi:phosphate transport system ATP-binding protein